MRTSRHVKNNNFLKTQFHETVQKLFATFRKNFEVCIQNRDRIPDSALLGIHVSDTHRDLQVI